MENTYTSLIEQEQAKIALLKAKIAECERRIEVLSSFLDADDLDTLLSKSLTPDSQKSSGSVIAAVAQRIIPVVGLHPNFGKDHFEYLKDPKRRLSDEVQSILRFIGLDGKSLDELESYCAAQQFSHNRGTLRSLMSNYKRKHGFIDSPTLGFFKLTDRALAFLDAEHPVVQSETPSALTEGVSNTSTETASTRTDSDGLI
jgi:hypothetical protein